MLFISSTFPVVHWSRSREKKKKRRAKKNSFTPLLILQLLIPWLQEEAPLNILFMCLTFSVFQLLSGWLKDCALENLYIIHILVAPRSEQKDSICTKLMSTAVFLDGITRTWPKDPLRFHLPVPNWLVEGCCVSTPNDRKTGMWANPLLEYSVNSYHPFGIQTYIPNANVNVKGFAWETWYQSWWL